MERLSLFILPLGIGILLVDHIIGLLIAKSGWPRTGLKGRIIRKEDSKKGIKKGSYRNKNLVIMLPLQIYALSIIVYYLRQRKAKKREKTKNTKDIFNISSIFKFY